jgi:hypothetical protein
MASEWREINNDFYLGPKSNRHHKLPVGIHKLCWDSDRNCFFTSLVQDKFGLPSKIYDMDSKFIKRAKVTWAETPGNLGILFTGLKGSGKTVTAKQICNNSNLPVIIIDEYYSGISSFISEILQDVVIFMDEYEKVFKGHTDSMLTIMDGSMDNGHRRIFLLTVNELTRVDMNILQRPGRIRYLKKYDHLPLSTIEEIVDDKLEHVELRKGIMTFLSKLDIISVDIVISVVAECNIHHEDPSNFADIFNISQKETYYKIFKIEEGKYDLLIDANVPSMVPFRDWMIGTHCRASNDYDGQITEIHSEYEITIMITSYDKFDVSGYENYRFRYEPIENRHLSFM